MAVRVGDRERDRVDMCGDVQAIPLEGELVGAGAGDGRAAGEVGGVPVVRGDRVPLTWAWRMTEPPTFANWVTPGKSTTPSFTSST